MGTSEHSDFSADIYSLGEPVLYVEMGYCLLLGNLKKRKKKIGMSFHLSKRNDGIAIIVKCVMKFRFILLIFIYDLLFSLQLY